jgi:hypothetical protein
MPLNRLWRLSAVDQRVRIQFVADQGFRKEYLKSRSKDEIQSVVIAALKSKTQNSRLFLETWLEDAIELGKFVSTLPVDELKTPEDALNLDALQLRNALSQKYFPFRLAGEIGDPQILATMFTKGLEEKNTVVIPALEQALYGASTYGHLKITKKFWNGILQLQNFIDGMFYDDMFPFVHGEIAVNAARLVFRRILAESETESNAEFNQEPLLAVLEYLFTQIDEYRRRGFDIHIPQLVKESGNDALRSLLVKYKVIEPQITG